MVARSELDKIIGLTSREAARILEEEGPNELPSSKQRGNLRIAIDVMREPMFLLLVACGVIYLMVGGDRWCDNFSQLSSEYTCSARSI